MNFFQKIKRPVSLLLAFMMMFPANSLPVFATEGIGTEPDETVVEADDTAELAEISEVDDSGFEISIDWSDTEFKNGSVYELYEDSNTSNAVKMRVTYSNKKVCEEGYEPGELVITVKGIGGVGRNSKIEAAVGADKQGSGTKNRDWTYTWNRANDTYTFLNNNEIRPNSVLSGYFDMIWQIDARSSIHLYSQEDVKAQIYLPDGRDVSSNVLSFTNETKCDTYQADIYTAEMYSYEGLTDGIDNPDDYVFIKYYLNSSKSTRSRGTNSRRFLFDPDVNDVGSGAIVIPTVVGVNGIEDGIYTLGMNETTYYGNSYIFVAYPKSEYASKTVTAGLEHRGTYYECDDEGNMEEKRLAYDDTQITITADFSFSDIPGDIYDYRKDTYYDKNVSSSVIQQRGGDIIGRKMVTGTTEKFYLEGSFNKPSDGKGEGKQAEEQALLNEDNETSDGEGLLDTSSGNDMNNPDGQEPPTGSGSDDLSAEPDNSSDGTGSDDSGEGTEEGPMPYSTAAPGCVYTFEMVDDFFYILQNDGTYRQLEAGEYEIKNLTIPAANSMKNINDLPLANGKYVYRVYAFTDGAAVNLDTVTPQEGFIVNSEKNISLPAGTTAVAIVIDGLEESIRSFSIPLEVKFHTDETKDDNLKSGHVVNTTFIRLYQNGVLLNDNFTADNYHDDTNLGLAQKDLDIYGDYLDREKDNITFYEGDRSDYRATTSLGSITTDGQGFYTDVTMGASFNFKEDAYPEKFSLYTVLPATLKIDDYSIEEDIWNIMQFSGFGLKASELAERATVTIDENYKDSGRTYVAVKFDLEGLVIPQSGNVYVKFKTKVDGKLFDNSFTLYIKSAVLIDEEVDIYTLGKSIDNGNWGSDPQVEKDIDNDGNTFEYLSYSSDYSKHVYVESSELQMTKSVKTSNISDFVQLPRIPKAEEGTDYIYELSIRNGASRSKNITVIDILENGPESEWKGTFKGIDLSRAEEEGLTGTVWYSDKTAPGEVGGSDWSEEMDAANVKAVAVDFGECELQPGCDADILITMTAPTDEALRGKKTHNNFSASFIMLDASTGNEIPTDENTLDSNYVKVELSAGLKNLVVTKVDATDKSRLTGVAFQLLDKNTQEVVAEAETNSRGQIVFKKVSADKVYILREVTPLQGYELAEDVEVILGDSSTTYVTVQNIRKKGSVAIYKTNSLNTYVKVQGAEYSLYKSDGTFVQAVETDINGKALFNDVEWGSYFIKETKAPEGYKTDPHTYPFSITRENVDTQTKFNVRDEQDGLTRVKLTKYEMSTTGVQTEIPLAGAVFRLVNLTGGMNYTEGTYVTDANGEIIIEDLVYGDYKFVESRIPAGFQKVEDVEFSISPQQKEKELIVYNKRRSGAINAYKHDNLGNIVTGAVFELYDETKNNVLGTYTSNDYGNIIINDLEWGTYYLKEKSAPECYQLSDEYVKVIINRNKLVADLDIENQTKKGAVVLTKTNEIGTVIKPEAEADRAKFSLYHEDGGIVTIKDKDGNEVQLKDLVQDENGQIRVEGLEWGKYYFKETKAPTGYSMTDESVRFAVNSINAGMEQELEVVNPLNAKTITLTKKILAEDINYANGDPTFLFKVEGTDIHGEYHEYYRIMKFNHQYVESNTDDEGFVSQSVMVSGLVAGHYEASEEESSRYELDEVTGIGDNTAVVEKVVLIDISEDEYNDGGALFVNSRYENADFSDNKSIANVIKRSRKLTSLKVEWFGTEEVEARKEIDKSLLKVTAIYDDGNTKELSDTEWSFGSEFSGSKFPNLNGEYEIPIEYTEGGITKGDSFFVTIYGAKAEIVRLEAAVKEGFETVEPETALTPDMFDVNAVYSDGATRTLLSENRLILNNEELKPASAKIYYFSFIGANKVKVSFSEDSVVSKYSGEDEVKVFSKNSDTSNDYSAISSFTGNALANSEVIALGDMVAINVVLQGRTTNRYLSVVMTPLDENGNEFCDFVLNPTTAPSEEGIFDVNISLNPELYDEEVSTTVHIEVKAPDPILMTGTKFNSTIPSEARGVVFTDEQVPEGYSYVSGTYAADANTYIDVSAEGDKSVVAWYESGTYTYKVSTQIPGKKVIANPDSSEMFYEYSSYFSHDLDVVDLAGLDTSRVTNMSNMFYGCESLDHIYTSGINTSNVTDMSGMFANCYYLETLDVSGFDTSNVTDMSDMFYRCEDVKTLDVSGFDTSNVTDMRSMFHGCEWLETLDVSGFDTSNVTDMSCMFCRCTWLETLDVSGFDTSKVTDMSSMFSGCHETIDVSGFDTSNVTDMSGMFSGCTSQTLDVSGFDTSKVTDMSSMFGYCQATLDLSGFDTSNVTNMSAMFYDCMIDSLDLSKFDTSKVTDMSGMFSSEFTNLQHLNVSSGVYEHADGTEYTSWNTSNVTDMSYMFYCCTKLEELDLSSFDTSNVTNMECMFASCLVLEKIDLSSFDTSNVEYMDSMFDVCDSIRDGYAYARTQADADRLNATSNKPTTWNFNSIENKVDLQVIIPNEYKDIVAVEIPKIVFDGTKIYLLSKQENKGIGKFTYSYNGVNTAVDGNYFTAPAGGGVVTIEDVTMIDQIIIETKHPYDNDMNEVVVGEHTFDGATSLKVELTYATEWTYFDWLYLYDADGNAYGKYGDMKETITITIPGNYIKAVFTSDGYGNDYGFKAIVTPIYE